MKKILILGASGMLGHITYLYFKTQIGYETYGLDKTPILTETESLDVLNFNELEYAISTINPDIIINCIGMLVKNSEDNLTSAILLNSYLPNLLVNLGNKFDFKLIHISTDCVFSGNKGAYEDNDFRDGNTNYARTKALGEVINNRDLTLRTSIIGPEITNNGTGLLDWFFKQRGTIKGFSRVFWSGVTTLELAKIMKQAINQNISGLYQITSTPKINKYDLLKKIKHIWNFDHLTIESEEKYYSDKSMISLRNDLKYNILPYDEMLIEMKEWINTHKELYSRYSV